MVIQDGHELKYQIKVHLAYKTNGGMLYDITVTCQVRPCSSCLKLVGILGERCITRVALRVKGGQRAG